LEALLVRKQNEAYEMAAIQADWRMLSKDENKGHVERWCAYCSARNDAADEIENKILSLKTEEPK